MWPAEKVEPAAVDLDGKREPAARKRARGLLHTYVSGGKRVPVVWEASARYEKCRECGRRCARVIRLRSVSVAVTGHRLTPQRTTEQCNGSRRVCASGRRDESASDPVARRSTEPVNGTSDPVARGSAEPILIQWFRDQRSSTSDPVAVRAE